MSQTMSGSREASTARSSAATRSGERAEHSGAHPAMASSAAESSAKSSWAAKRTARSIRSESSVKRSRASPTQRIRRRDRSSRPPKGSVMASEASIAIAFMVKSRRDKSSSSREVKRTESGRRWSL